MSKKQFTLDSWLKDKSQKVVTRCGFPVRIVCTDVKRKDYPILALVERDDQEEYQSFTKDGRFSLYNPLHDNFDLFIETADEVSEDERVRKALIDGFTVMKESKNCGKTFSNHNIPVSDILAWLEKQKEYESTDFEYVWDRTDCGELTAALDKYSEEAIINMCHAWYDKGIELERKSWLEKQGKTSPVLSNSSNIGKDEQKSLGYVHHIDEDGYYTKEAILEPNPYTGTWFDYNGHHWGMCARDGGVEILMDGNITSRVFPDKNNIIEQKPTDSYCKETCKGFQETGKCFADGECKAKKEAEQKLISEEDEPQKELAKTYLVVFDKKFPILPTLKGKRLADYKNFLNKCQQIFGLKYWSIRPTQAKLFEKLSLLWAAWGAEHLQGLGQTDGDMDDEISIWSEEDEMFVHGLIRGLAAKRDIHGHTTFSSDCIDITKTMDWLKSLKGRVQPKQEWNEEDEQHIDSLLKRLDALCRNKLERTRFAISEDREWLKSLRPQNHWKPSDEHIGLLQAIINEPNNAASESCQIVLKDILEQLKKLKKEQT